VFRIVGLEKHVYEYLTPTQAAAASFRKKMCGQYNAECIYRREENLQTI
jgi:hypothetical protein